MKNFTKLVANFFIYLALLVGFSVLFMSVPICFLLINVSLKLHSLVPLIATFGWCFIVLRSIQYFHKKYFPDSDTEAVTTQVAPQNLTPQSIGKETFKVKEPIKNKDNFEDVENVSQILKFFLVSIVTRLLALGILLTVINFIILPILVTDLELLSECQRNVSLYGLVGGLLFIAAVCAINEHQKKDKRADT